MANTNFDQMAWQKSIIRSDEYKDIIPARDNVQKQFEKTVKKSLLQVKRRIEK